MHVNPLSVSSITVQYGRDNDQLLFGDKVPNASLVPGGLALGHWMEIELEGRGEGNDGEQQPAEKSC